MVRTVPINVERLLQLQKVCNATTISNRVVTLQRGNNELDLVAVRVRVRNERPFAHRAEGAYRNYPKPIRESAALYWPNC